MCQNLAYAIESVLIIFGFQQYCSLSLWR